MYTRTIKLLLFALVFWHAKLFAQDVATVSVELKCFVFKELSAKLVNEFNETPVIIGKSDSEPGVYTMIFVNLDTQSYTIVETNGQAGCITGTGKHIRSLVKKNDKDL